MKSHNKKRDDLSKEENIYEDPEGLAVIEEQISDTYNEGTIDQKENK